MLQAVAAALIKRYPIDGTTADAGGPDVAGAAIVGRHEFFGSLIYTRRHADYIAFDAEVTAILSRAQERPMHELTAALESAHQQSVLERFAALCREAGLLDGNGRLDGLFLARRPSEHERLSAPMRVCLSCTRASTYPSASAVMPAGLPVPGELTTREVKALIDAMAAAGCFVLDLDGGDPLVRADLPSIIEHANDSGVAVAVTTNAGAATREVVEELQRLQIQAFTVRLEGATPAIVDAVRGRPGAFEMAFEGIQRLRTLGVPVSLQWPVITTNAGELHGMAGLVSRLDLQQLFVSPLTVAGSPVVPPELLLGPDEIERLYTDAEAVAKSAGVAIVTPRRSVKTLFPDRCACGTTRCFVDPRGHVSPSGFTTDVGDSVRERTLDDIWRSSPAFETVWRQPAVAPAECPSCAYFRT
jgi:MoaA/NifB/PqqE/SkfB family radical SAM enzyme